MNDCRVRNILTQVKTKVNAGQSPVDYIDGVLDSIPDQATIETAGIQKAPGQAALFGAASGNGQKPLF